MNRSKNKQIVIALAITGIAVLLGGCGSTPAGVVAPGITTGNTAANNYTIATCLPVNGLIGFNAINITDNGNTIKAGSVPAQYDLNYYVGSQGGTFGTVQLITASAAGNYRTLPSAPDGLVTLNVVNAPTAPASSGPGVGVGSGISATGYIQLSQTKLNQIALMAGSNGILTTTGTVNTNNYCVTSVAFSLGIGNGTVVGGTATTLYNGYVIMNANLNGQAQVIVLKF
jgi:hypothetical protein